MNRLHVSNTINNRISSRYKNQQCIAAIQATQNEIDNNKHPDIWWEMCSAYDDKTVTHNYIQHQVRWYKIKNTALCGRLISLHSKFIFKLHLKLGWIKWMLHYAKQWGVKDTSKIRKDTSMLKREQMKGHFSRWTVIHISDILYFKNRMKFWPLTK